MVYFVGPQEAAPEEVPARVSNYQARFIMRGHEMPDGRSLFTWVDSDLRSAVDATREMPEMQPERVEADRLWQAWEQANEYERYGTVTGLIAARYASAGITEAVTDELFIAAGKVRA